MKQIRKWVICAYIWSVDIILSHYHFTYTQRTRIIAQDRIIIILVIYLYCFTAQGVRFPLFYEASANILLHLIKIDWENLDLSPGLFLCFQPPFPVDFLDLNREPPKLTGKFVIKCFLIKQFFFLRHLIWEWVHFFFLLFRLSFGTSSPN